MLTSMRTFLVAALAIALAVPVLAADDKQPEQKPAKKAAAQAEKEPGKKKEKKPAAKGEKAKQGEKKPKSNNVAGPFQMPKGIKLSPDQSARLASVQEKYSAKLKSAQQAAKLTKDQAAKRKSALAKAQADGHKGKKAQALADDAIGLSAEQRKAREDLAAVRKEIEKAKRSILTDEQKASLPGKKNPKKAKQAS
jgi:glucose/arabinose dehydrogenase